MTSPSPDQPPHRELEARAQRAPRSGPHMREAQKQTPQQQPLRSEELEWDWPHIVVEAVTVVVCAPMAVVLIATDAAERMSGWWWLVVAGMLATWAGESVGKLASQVSAVRAARTRHRLQRVHTGARYLNGPDFHRRRRHDNMRGYADMPLRRDDSPRSGDPR